MLASRACLHSRAGSTGGWLNLHATHIIINIDIAVKDHSTDFVWEHGGKNLAQECAIGCSSTMLARAIL